jgi:hypothetical protein
MDEIDSPCIDICTIDRDSGECIGCGRTVEDVRNWANFDNLKKKQILENLNAIKMQCTKLK